MKRALICYHSRANIIYLEQWVSEYRHSVLNQTYKDFDIVELNYDGGSYRVFENSNYHSKEFPTFVHGLNYLLDSLFFAGYDCVFNSNLDDYFSLDRIEKQLPYIEQGFDLVSSNFALIQGDKIIKTHSFDKLDIEYELAHNHNIIGHASVVYNKSFWKKHRYIPEQQPMEDLMLWQRAIKNSKFIILPDVLLFHRLHSNSVCQSENR